MAVRHKAKHQRYLENIKNSWCDIIVATHSKQAIKRGISHNKSEYHTQLAKMSFDKIFNLTAGVYFYFNKYSYAVKKTIQTEINPK